MTCFLSKITGTVPSGCLFLRRVFRKNRPVGGLWILLFACFPAAGAGEDGPPIVGAIRWDAWYGQDGPVCSVEKSLGPPKYHFRLPWFARVTGEETVDIDGDSREIMDKEIACAARAGLNYWAFVDYGEGSPMMRAFTRYLDAGDKRGLRFCFIETGAALDAAKPGDWRRLVEYFKHPDYQTVLDGRPLLYVFLEPKKIGKKELQALGDAAVAAGLKRPYLVLMGFNPEHDARVMEGLGFDAISAYSHTGDYTMHPKSYAAMCEDIRCERWDKARALGVPCVTFASAGWDTRPRNERPPPWITWVGAGQPDQTPPDQQTPLIDVTTATPAQLSAHLRAALEWTRNNRDLNPSNAIIIYAWNENDEGGWLIPTLGAGGVPDEGRIDAAGEALR